MSGSQVRRGAAIALGGLMARTGSGMGTGGSVCSPMVRQGRAISESFFGIRFSMSRLEIARMIGLAALSVVAVFVATTRYHLPLMRKIAAFHNKMPSAPLPVKFKRGDLLRRDISNQELMEIEEQALEWHEKLWDFRTEIIKSIALVNMDDEEDFELEMLNKNSDGRSNNERWPWLTGHLVSHLLLTIIAHVYESWLLTLSALYSQCLFLALFLRAKALGDAVSSAVTVVRKFARNMGSRVSVSSPERTLLQFQVLQNKMEFLTDVHESHQLGMGFFVPFVGTLDIDLDTLLSISCGCLFELIVLMVTRVHAHVVRHRSAELVRQESIREEQSETERLVNETRRQKDQEKNNAMMRDNVENMAGQIKTLQRQVKDKMEELEVLFVSAGISARPGTAGTSPRMSHTSLRAHRPFASNDDSHETSPTIASAPSMSASPCPVEARAAQVGTTTAVALELAVRNFLRCKSVEDQVEHDQAGPDLPAAPSAGHGLARQEVLATTAVRPAGGGGVGAVFDSPTESKGGAGRQAQGGDLNHQRNQLFSNKHAPAAIVDNIAAAACCSDHGVAVPQTGHPATNQVTSAPCMRQGLRQRGIRGDAARALGGRRLATPPGTRDCDDSLPRDAAYMTPAETTDAISAPRLAAAAASRSVSCRTSDSSGSMADLEERDAWQHASYHLSLRWQEECWSEQAATNPAEGEPVPLHLSDACSLDRAPGKGHDRVEEIFESIHTQRQVSSSSGRDDTADEIPTDTR